VIAELCRPAQMLACHHPTNTVEVSGKLPILRVPKTYATCRSTPPHTPKLMTL